MTASTDTLAHTDIRDAHIAQLQADLAEARHHLATRESAHERFETQVRDMAIRLYHEGQWCFDGLNSHLSELGLAEYTPGFTVEATLTVNLNVLHTASEDTAKAWVHQALGVTSNDDDVVLADQVSVEVVSLTPLDEEH